jgi:hypothetical protein
MAEAPAVWLSTFADGMYELPLVRLECLDRPYDCSRSGLLRAPVQSQRWDKEEKDNYDPYIREKVQSKRTQFFFVEFKSFAEPGAIGVPQGQGDNPVEQGEEDPNSEGTQEQVSEESDFFAFHDSSVISDGGIGARLFGRTKSA